MGLQKELLRRLAPSRKSSTSSTRDDSSSEGSSPTSASPIALKSRSRNASLVLPVYQPLPRSHHQVLRSQDLTSPSNHLVVDLDRQDVSGNFAVNDESENNNESVTQSLLPAVTPTLRAVVSSLEGRLEENNNTLTIVRHSGISEESV